MAYVEGFVVAVRPQTGRLIAITPLNPASFLGEFGVTRMVEAWGDDVPDGKLNDF